MYLYGRLLIERNSASNRLILDALLIYSIKDDFYYQKYLLPTVNIVRAFTIFALLIDFLLTYLPFLESVGNN